MTCRRETVADITHRNAMRHFGFDPFAHRPPERCTVGALRSEATHVDVGPAEPRAGRSSPRSAR